MTEEPVEKPSAAMAVVTGAINGVTLRVKVVPKASRSQVEGVAEGALKVRVAAPPVDGAANEELIRILAKFFHTPKTSIRIASGGGSRIKRVTLGKVSLEEAGKLLASLG